MAIFTDVFPVADFDKKSATTTDDTATEVLGISLAEEQTALVYTMATARNADGSINGTFIINSAWYRNAAGDVTQVGATMSINTEVTAASTIAVTHVADTANQKISLRVTGETSETISWTTHTKYIIVTH